MSRLLYTMSIKRLIWQHIVQVLGRKRIILRPALRFSIRGGAECALSLVSLVFGGVFFAGSASLHYWFCTFWEVLFL